MKLIDEIIEILSSETGKLSDALIKTKVLLHKIGHKELVPWVNNELNGYPNRESVPDYRLIPAMVLANISNMAYQYTAHPIPLGHLEKKHREKIETARMEQSLAVLEEFAKKQDGHLQALIPIESYPMLRKGLDKSYHIQKAWSEVGYTSVLQIITQVRFRLLDFVLELRDQIPSNLDETKTQERIDGVDAKNLFNNAMFGDNVTIVLGAGNTNTTTITNIKGDFSQLEKTLLKNGVSQDDINELQDAIEIDRSVVDPSIRKYGPAVKSWLQKMLAKAVETSWNIELGIAGSLLATALNNFYGWF